MVKSDNLAPQKARLNFHQGILNSMLFNLFRPMESDFLKFSRENTLYIPFLNHTYLARAAGMP